MQVSSPSSNAAWSACTRPDPAAGRGRGPRPGAHPRPRPCSRGERPGPDRARARRVLRSEEHTSELQSLMRISYAVFCLKKKIHIYHKLEPLPPTKNTLIPRPTQHNTHAPTPTHNPN